MAKDGYRLVIGDLFETLPSWDEPFDPERWLLDRA